MRRAYDAGVNFTSRYIEQNLHLLWLHPMLACNSSDLSSKGGLNVTPV